jgi:hypothetical protein
MGRECLTRAQFQMGKLFLQSHELPEKEIVLSIRYLGVLK